MKTLLILMSLLLASTAQAQAEMPLYVGQAQPGWKLVVTDFESQALLQGDAVTVPKPAKPQVPDSQVGLRREGDALTLHWHQAWIAALRFEPPAPLDLRAYQAEGVLAFDLKVAAMADGGLSIKMGCGPANCERKINQLMEARAMVGKGWQRLAFKLSCFQRDGSDYGAVRLPFSLEGSGIGEVSVARIRLLHKPEPGMQFVPCPDYRTESVTPQPLIQPWALTWWMPRHEEKLAEIRRRAAAGERTELLMIGDSITQAWDDVGKPVIARTALAQYRPLSLGFGGDKTENVLWRLQHGELKGLDPRVVMLMIGTNNTGDRAEDPRTTAAGIRRLLAEIRQQLPASRILLLAVFPREQSSSGFLRQINDRINGLISGYADADAIHFLNINEQLTRPDGSLSTEILPDLLHLSEAGYQVWAEAITPTLQRLMALPRLANKP
ncbi:GDSL-type esterase/lipase family protein [Pelomonas sp. SE-A7]|uniref:GDSL-type esterase/lipase family protein n=1 Tax=Pelomonas sp. SE-A7 TaxID=3054953 RepID=UPI00259D1CDA|nr:GDSL-type esterase/lipase family protein [Pelomonas sp. SE-A7]MDM4765197.1 putative glycoside hydrolase [Pelomonas sp. SE-A7]